MENLNLIKKIINNTNHTIESIAEILNVDIEELQLETDLSNKKINHYQIKILSDFLDSYALTFEGNSSRINSSK